MPPSQEKTPIRVVLADDHPLVREGIRTVLDGAAGIVVVGEASDGEEAAHQVEELRPDVVIMDIAMPRLNGVEATRRIKALFPAAAVLILTAYDDDIYVFTLLEAGAAGYLMKDVLAEDLVKAVIAVQAGEAVLSPAVLQKVVAHLTQSQAALSRVPEPEILTVQEKAVLRLATRGLSNKAIGRELSLSPRTIQAHLTHIFNKLGVASRTEAVVTCLKRGWLEPEDIG